MRIDYPSNAFPNYYDRGISDISISHMTQHGGGYSADNLELITIPVGYNGVVRSWILYTMRMTAAGTPNYFTAMLYKNFGSDNLVLGAMISSSNNVGSVYAPALATEVWLAPGDTVGFSINDICVGGVVQYMLAAQIFQFRR